MNVEQKFENIVGSCTLTFHILEQVLSSELWMYNYRGTVPLFLRIGIQRFWKPENSNFMHIFFHLQKKIYISPASAASHHILHLFLQLCVCSLSYWFQSFLDCRSAKSWNKFDARKSQFGSKYQAELPHHWDPNTLVWMV